MMKKGGIRQSLYRNITLTAPAEWSYSDVRCTPFQSSANDVNLLACGLEGTVAYVDAAGGGSSVAVIPGFSSLDESRAAASPLTSAVVRINVGGGAINSLQWNPFVPGQLATASSNGTVNLWDVPITDDHVISDVIVADDNACVGTYVSSGTTGSKDGSAREVAFHPCASSIIALRKQRSLEIWDLQRTDAPIISVPLPAGDPSSMSTVSLPTSTSSSSVTDATEDLLAMAWSYMGDTVATIDKARNLHLHDPRAASVAAWVPQVHGIGASRVSWCNDSSYFVTTGLSAATRTREFALWDVRMLDQSKAPLKREKVGGGSSSGYVLPLFDLGSGLVFMCGSGDSGVRVYEFQAGELHPICNAAACGDLAKSGYALLPRADCDLMGSEVARIFKLVQSGVQAVRVEVPRKTRAFHPELYPPAPGYYPSLTGDSWFVDGQTLPPYLMTAEMKEPKNRSAKQATTTPEVTVEDTQADRPEMSTSTSSAETQSASGNDDSGGGGGAATATATDDTEGLLPPPPPPTPPTTPYDTHTPSAPAPPPPSASLLPAAAAATTQQQQQQQHQHLQRFKHVYGTGITEGFDGGGGSFNLRPLLTSSTSTSPIAASLLYWAVPWVGGGGPVYVAPHTSSGKVLPDCPLVNGHKGDVLSIAFSPFDDCLMATGSEDHTIKLWRLPDGQPLTSSLGDDDAYHVITGNDTVVRHVVWHPLLDNVIISAAVDSSIRIFELSFPAASLSTSTTVSPSTSSPAVTSSPIRIFKALSHPILSLDINRSGCLLACSGSDGQLSVMDLRIKEEEGGKVVVWECAAPYRGQQVAWWGPHGAATELLVTTGLSKTAQRKLCLWDWSGQPSGSEPLNVVNVDSSNGALIPMVCEATGLIVCGSRGDSTIKVFEIITKPKEEEKGGGTDSGTLTLTYQAKFCSDFRWAGRAGGLCGVCLLPQRSASALDVANVEVAKVLVLTPQAVDMVRFWLPRSDELKQYFQDDVYVDVRQATSSVLTSADWLLKDNDEKGEGGERLTELVLGTEYFTSLRPEGMTPLSEKPVPLEPVVSKAAQFRQEMEERATVEQLADEEFGRLQQLANQNVAFNPNLSAGVRRGVDQAPVLDADEDDWSD